MGLEVWSACCCFLLIYLVPSYAAQRYPFLQEAANASTLQEFDYIIVGGGTAGCALAATLSQQFKVLVLERGGSPYGNPNVTRRENFGANLANEGDDTPLQGFVSTEGIRNARARVLGGGSSVNAGVYSRASMEYIRRAGLDGRLVNSSYDWVERVVASIPQLDPYQAAIRNSLLEAGVTPDNGATYDNIIGTKTTGTIFDNQGNRRPASDLLQHANPDNIQVVLHATVQRVLLKGLIKRAYGVLYNDPQGQRYIATLNSRSQSEIILSSGALGSPQLLMLSGVGPAEHLQAMGIKVILNLPGVGKKMADNPQSSISIPSPTPLGSSREQVVGITSYGSFIEGGSRSDRTGSLGAVVGEVAGPLSTGELFLRTLNASDNPLVTFNYFREPQDLQTCIAVVNILEELILSNSFRPYRFGNQTLPSGGTVSAPNRRSVTFAATINSTIANFCKQDVGTAYHYHGGCRIGTVLDNKYRVLGVKALRVVDGSTFQFSPGTNPHATVLMLGRYMGMKILTERRISE